MPTPQSEFSKACRTKFLFTMTKLCKKLDFFVWISNTLEFSWEAQACFFLCLCHIILITVYSVEVSSLAGHASMSISFVIRYRITGLQDITSYLCYIFVVDCLLISRWGLYTEYEKSMFSTYVKTTPNALHNAQVLFTPLSCLLSMPSKIHEQFCDLGIGVLHRSTPLMKI
jgi:hypothetical protein